MLLTLLATYLGLLQAAAAPEFTGALLHYYDLAARVVFGSSIALAVFHYLGTPILDIWAPREEFPRVRATFDKVEKTVQVVSISPQKIRAELLKPRSE